MPRLKHKYLPLKVGEKIRAVFLFQAGTVWASMESVYHSCLSDERFLVKLVLVEETTVESSHMIGAKEFLNRKRLEYITFDKLDLEKDCPHIVFIQFPYDAAFHTPQTLSIQFKNRGIRIVYIPYGIEISDTEIARKDHFQSYVVENSWRIYTCCEGIKKEYLKYCRNRHAVRVCGSPKFDGISEPTKLPLPKEIVKAADGRKIIVWKMHFPKKIVEHGEVRQITPRLEEYIKFAEKIGKYQDLFFLVLAHPKMVNGVVASDIQGDGSLMEDVGRMFGVLKGQPNVWIDSTEDYRPSLYHGDAVILDRSGVIIEAVMTEVPVLYMKNKEYEEKMTAPVQKVVDSLYTGYTCRDMERFLDRFRMGDDSRAAQRIRCLEENFPFRDGLCGWRIKEDLVESLREKMPDYPRIILYGTGEICRYYMERQDWRHPQTFEVLKVVDTSEKKWGMDFYGYSIEPPERILEVDFDGIVIMTEPHYFEIKKKLVYEMYLDERKIWRLDEFIWELNRQ